MVLLQLYKDIKIIQIYPFNNPVSANNTKPVVLAGLPYVIFSKFYDNILIISSFTENPYCNKVITINAKNNQQYYKEIVKFLYKLPKVPNIIEVHQDIKLAALISKRFKNKVSLCLIKHNTVLYRSFYEKFKFVRNFYEKIYLNKLTYIFCVSNYVTNHFKKNYPKSLNKFNTIYNTYGHINRELINFDIKKKNIITFIGKPLKYKGIFIFLKAVNKFLKFNNIWKVMIIAAKFSSKPKYGKIFLNLRKENKCKKSTPFILYENLSIDEVIIKLKQSKIAVFPQIWSEPFGLATLEAHIAGCIVVSSGRGGLREVSGEYAYYLKDLNEQSLLNILMYISNNINEANDIAKKGQNRVLSKFNPLTLNGILDNIRSKLFNKTT